MIARLLERCAVAAIRRPGIAIGLALILAALATALAAGRLELRTSNLDLVSPELPPVSDFRDFATSFGTPNMLVIVLDGPSEASLREAVSRVASRVRSARGVRAVLARLPYEESSLAWLDADPYFASRDRHQFYVFVQPDDPTSAARTIEPFVRGVRQAVAEAALEPLGVDAGLTGLPQYALDDRDVIQRDITRLSAVSFVLVLAIFVAAFGSFLRPVLAMVGLALVAAWVLGFAAAFPGHLTLLSAFFFSALFGLGSDYGIFLIDVVEERMAEGRAHAAALVDAVRFLAPDLTTEALSTAAAFLALTASGFRGFAELGWIGAVGIVLALGAMVVLLPAMLALLPVHTRRVRRATERRLGRILRTLSSPTLAVLVVALTLAGATLGLPAFDVDYLALEPRGSDAVRLERGMIERSELSPQFAAFVVHSPERARHLGDLLRSEETVGTVRSIADLERLDALAVPIPDERDEFARSFVSGDGRFAVYAYPSGNVWEPAFADRFLAAMRAYDARVTGMPVLGRFMIDLARRALVVTGGLSLLAILALVWAQFRSVRQTLVAVTPVGLGLVAMGATMKLLGLGFNPLNVMAFPVVLGTGVDAGVHITHRFLAERGDLERTLATSGRAVLVSSLTTIAGFGTLALTTHRGLASFALALTIGVTTSLVLSLVVLPQLLLHTLRRTALKEPSCSTACVRTSS